MVKLIHLLLLSFLAGLLSCSSCSTDENEGRDTLLDKEYTFIVGILAADSIDDYRHEIFVGRIRPIAKDEHIPSGEDPWSYLVTITMHNFYLATVEGDDGSAIVSIHKSTGDSVLMQSVGNGLYRDVDNQLNTLPATTYQLKVYSNGNYYEAQTTTPGYFRSNIQNDTVTVPIQSWFDIYKGSITFPMTTSLGAFFYRDWVTTKIFDNSNQLIFQADAIDHFFNSSEANIFLSMDSSCIRDSLVRCYAEKSHEIVAVDANYAKIYRAGGTFTGTLSWFNWFDQYNSLPVKTLSFRSSIQGTEPVGGVFGSIYRIRKNYIVRPVLSIAKTNLMTLESQKL
ncbi:hypothetical protein JNM05_00655 [bacterium]|nr:hypothetical protein [bacterium]